MRIVFMGTPQLAASILQKVDERHEVVGVFTRPDAVRGRGKKLVASSVKTVALDLGLPVFTPKSLNGEDVARQLRELSPDVICVAAYGCLLPKAILDIPAHGCLNVHTSLLPRWRGAAPIERAILAGDEETGVCIMHMEEGLDTGPYCLCERVPLGTRNLQELTGALANAGSQALLKALDLVESGKAVWREQSQDGLVYAEKVMKGELDFAPEEPVRDIAAKVRASSESHPSKTCVAGRVVSVLEVLPVSPSELPGGDRLEPGEVSFLAKRLVICAADGLLELRLLKPDGKKTMDGRSFAAGLQGIKNAALPWGSVQRTEKSA